MRRPMLRVFVLFLLCALLPVTAWAADPPPLQNGVPFNTYLNALTFANVYIDVPAGATKLTVTVTNGSGDLDLYLKFGARLSGGTLGDLQANSDARSESTGSSETITLTTTSTPPVKAGRWYIATLNLNSVTTNFTLTAQYEVPAQTYTPGTAALLSLKASDRALAPWADFRLAYEIKSYQPNLKADLYLAVAFEGGGLFLIDRNYNLATSLVPFAINIPLVDGETPFLGGRMPAAVPPLSLTFYAILVRSGADASVPSNWLSLLTTNTVHIKNLTGIQETILGEYGDPQAMHIEFDHAAQLRVEHWVYEATSQHLGKTFRFVNGNLSGGDSYNSGGGGARSRKKADPPVTVGPARINPETSMSDLSLLVGDPAVIYQGSTPDTKILRYPKARLKVTLTNGKIREMGAY